ncbi:hypothetical protein [uncultured Hyphomonas sp.]|uniref:hypothetical protein n=1 Tax=uncultured Hyphomonas sp. TaxID=225298 RepID=UPI002AAAD098|nr:hypothetical protein [uncultured Hyphomonas sp.]
MLKQISLASALALMAGPASASPELAELWGAKAATLAGDSAALLDTARQGRQPALDEEYVIEVERFAFNATRLGGWTQQAGIPSAIGCSFLSLGEAAEMELEALEGARSARASADALNGLMSLFADARSLSAAAAWSARHPSGHPVALGTPAACPEMPARINRVAVR